MSFSRTLRGVLVVVSAIFVWGIASAEVSTTHLGPRWVSTMLMDRIAGITDGADPIPQLRWTPYRKVNPRLLLNASGAIRHDGRPDVAFQPGSIWPFVTWAYNLGTDHDIAFSYWNGDGWSETEFLTFDIADEVDPRVFVSTSGAIHVVWAVNGPDPRAMMSSRRINDSRWSPPRRLTAPNEHVAKPTIVAVHGSIWIAYERSINVDGDATPAVVMRRVGEEEPSLNAHAFPSHRQEDMDPLLHANAGRVWLDWKFSDDQFAFVVLEGPGAGELHVIPWTDTSWVGVESTRLSIQRRVMSFRDPDVISTGGGTAEP